MQSRLVFTAASVIVFTATSWLACRATPSGEATATSVTDGGASANDAFVVPEVYVCDPCLQVCMCSPGATFFSPGTCMTSVCDDSGLWGGQSCVGSGCPDAGDEASDDDADATEGTQEAGGAMRD